MKIKVNNEKANRLVSCGMVVLVTAAYKDKVTITPCAWHMPISRSPASIGISLARTHFSSEAIQKSEEFVINVPDWTLLDKLILCGSMSGRSVDKFKEAKLTRERSGVLTNAPIVGECIGNIECSLLDVKEVGNHFLFVGEAVCVQVEEKFFSGDFWNTDKVDLIFHLGSKFFFKSSPYAEYNQKCATKNK